MSILVLAVLGIAVGVADKVMPDRWKITLGAWDSAAHGRFERLKDKPLAEWMRGRRALLTLFALVLVIAIPIVYQNDDLGGFLLGVMAACSVLMLVAIWFLGRSRSNWGFAGRFALVVCLFVALLYGAEGLALKNSGDNGIAFIGVIYLSSFVLLLFVSYFLVMLFPFLVAGLLGALLGLVEGYYRYCILNNKLPTMLVFVILGGLASAYRVIHG